MMAQQPFFPGDSELARRMRELDWSSTDLGPPELWPENLRTSVSLCLTSRIPVVMYWGPDFTVLYNDAYISFLGTQKHPRYLGRPCKECWFEIWDTIGPMLKSVYATAKATWSEDVVMFFARRLPLEEVYVRFTFGPILAADGKSVQGIFCPCTETSEQVIGARRLDTLRKLGARTTEARTKDAAARAIVEALADNPRDIAFAAVYLIDAGAELARLCSASGLEEGHPFPSSVSIHVTGTTLEARLARAVRERVFQQLDDLSTICRRDLHGVWPEPVRQALALPILAGQDIVGLVLVGVSPRRILDSEYRTFFDLVTRQAGTAIAEALAYEAERKRAEELAALDRAKTLFFSNISHEFRTPLTLMIGPTEDALASPEGALAGAALETVYRNELRLLKLVNTLLDFSRLEAGRIGAAYEPTDLCELTAEIASNFRSAMERSGLAFDVECEELGERIYVDREQWEKIVLNLLSNAFKFTLEGRIGLTLRDRGDDVELNVSDSGEGIAAQDLERIFERFQRVEGVRARTYEGSGIGLALVHDFVKLHGGRVTVRSQLGSGSTFSVSIPKGNTHLPADKVLDQGRDRTLGIGTKLYVNEALSWSSERAQRLSSGSERENKVADRASGSARILVVDDNADMREYLARILEKKWMVETAVDGLDALQKIRSLAPDLVLTDIMMPNLDGFGLLQQLRADRETSALPVIMLSARAGEEGPLEGLTAGADDYMIKPFSARELVARVRIHLELARARQAARAESETARAANHAKDEFLAMLGHELRNPLSPILTAVNLMRLRGSSSREQEIIERQVANLTRLVDDLLDVARIARGKVELRKQCVELAEVVSTAIEIASPLLEQRRHYLDLDVPNRGLPVDVDPGRMSQVIANLLTNAAKYSDPGSRIRVRAERRAQAVRLTVSDQGIGLEPSMLRAIFDMFVQRSQGLERPRGGLGLGLTIARSLTEMHGGSIVARSEGPGEGAQFEIELPAAQMPETAADERHIETEQPQVEAAKRKRILVVDDNEDASELLADALRTRGHEVQVAYDAPTALTVSESFAPDVALLDIGLPIMDGYELARRLRDHTKRGQPRMIAVTGYGGAVDRERSRAAGFDEHLVKPVDFAHLEVVIENLF